MLKIEVIAIGKLKEDYLRAACGEYSKRLGAFCSFSVTELKEYKLPDNPSPAQIEKCIQEEGREILSRVPRGCALITLCIEGQMLTSPQLAVQLEEIAAQGSSHVVLIIGGSYGLSEEVKGKSRLRLSMSRMTFPHQLARVMLLEQLYRACTINAGTKYHK